MVKVITVCTDNKFYFPYLENTCMRFGGEFIVLGYGEKWGGYAWKFEKMIEYLLNIDPNEFIVFVDGYDVICVQDLATIEEKYREVQKINYCKVLIATEKTILPKFISNLYFGTVNGVLLNSGTYLGFAGDVLDVLTKAKMIYPAETDDQILITSYAKISGNEICIDTNTSFFYTNLSPLKEMELNHQAISPYFIHAPGCGLLTTILTDMGYIVDDDIKNELYSLFADKVVYHTKEFIKRNYIIFIVVILIILILTRRR